MKRLGNYTITQGEVSFHMPDGRIWRCAREEVKQGYNPCALEDKPLEIANLFSKLLCGFQGLGTAAMNPGAVSPDDYGTLKRRARDFKIFEVLCARAAFDIQREDALKEYHRLWPVHQKLPTHRRQAIVEFDENGTGCCMEYDDPCDLQVLCIEIMMMKEDIDNMEVYDFIDSEVKTVLKASRVVLAAMLLNRVAGQHGARAHRRTVRSHSFGSPGNSSDGDSDSGDPPGPSHSLISLSNYQSNSSSSSWRRPGCCRVDWRRAA